MQTERYLDYKVNVRNPSGHPGQMLLYTAKQKKIIIRAGRRGGKTTGAGMKAVLAFIDGRRVLYAAPTIDQVEKFWTEVKRSLEEPLSYGILYKNETEHLIEHKGTEQRIRAKTAWNADTLRGDYADVLILDEWQMMDENAWTTVGAPMLIDNNGDVVFIYTPPSLESRSVTKASDPHHAAKLYKAAKLDPEWLCIHFSSEQNPHVSREGLAQAAKNMSETAFRQEILAEDLDEVPGALWTREILKNSRHTGELPEMRRIVVAIDPSGGNTTEVGIVAAGEGVDGHYYVMNDESMIASRPKEWAERAIRLYKNLGADRIIAERNYGGDMVEETLRNVDPSVSYHDVNATRGKLVRAEPVLALFQKKMMHMAGTFPLLEDELCSYTAAPGQKSPNRLDAMVWCGIELSGQGALGLLDFFKSGKAKSFMETFKSNPAAKTPAAPAPSYGAAKAAAATTLAAVAVADNTPRCPECSAVTLQNLSAHEKRCIACGHQWFPGGKPELLLPSGSRRISLRK